MRNTLDTHVRILLRAYLDVRVRTKARYLGRTRAECHPCGSGRDIVTHDFALTPRTCTLMHAHARSWMEMRSILDTHVRIFLRAHLDTRVRAIGRYVGR